MRSAYRVLALLIALGVFVQAAAIAFGWFDVIHDLEDGGTFTKDSEFNAGHIIHGMNGMMVIPALSLILLIVSFFAKIPGGVKFAGFIVLAVIAQIAFAFIAFAAAPVVGALHGMNALVILGLAINAARKASAPAPVETSDTADSVGAPAV